MLFFTVFGSAGRLDVLYYSATQKLAKGKTIYIWNYSNMRWDLIYIDDIVEGIYRVMQGAQDKRHGEAYTSLLSCYLKTLNEDPCIKAKVTKKNQEWGCSKMAQKKQETEVAENSRLGFSFVVK